MYRGTRRRSWRRPTLLVVLAIVTPQLILAAILAAGLGVLPNGFPGKDRSTIANATASQKDQHLVVGECVRSGSTSKTRYVEVACDDHRAVGTVIDVVDGDEQATEACNEQTDVFATQPKDGELSIPSSTPGEQAHKPAPLHTAQTWQVACLRKLEGPHPGDSGAGGGVYRSGDCVAGASDLTAGVREVACTDPDVFEIVTARVKTVAECPDSAYRFAALQHGADRILCLGDGAGIASPGECMTDPSATPITFEAVDCGAPETKARVLARVASAAQCRELPAQTHYVEDPSGLPNTRVVCLAVS